MQFLFMDFELSERLAKGGFDFGSYQGCRVLLKNNAHYPWFVIVPEVGENVEELTDLSVDQYDSVMNLVHSLSVFIKENFNLKKVNLGCVGIVVKQLHLHVVGRHEGDPAWPGVVWGSSEKSAYSELEVEGIKSKFVANVLMGLFGEITSTSNQ